MMLMEMRTVLKLYLEIPSWTTGMICHAQRREKGFVRNRIHPVYNCNIIILIVNAWFPMSSPCLLKHCQLIWVFRRKMWNCHYFLIDLTLLFWYWVSVKQLLSSIAFSLNKMSDYHHYHSELGILVFISYFILWVLLNTQIDASSFPRFSVLEPLTQKLIKVPHVDVQYISIS